MKLHLINCYYSGGPGINTKLIAFGIIIADGKISDWNV